MFVGRRGQCRLLRALSLGAALGCAAALGLAPLARADTGDEKRQADQRVAELQDALEGTSTELAKAYLSLQQTQAQVPPAEAALADATAKAKAAAAYSAEVSAKLAVAKANEARAAEASAKTAATLDTTQRTLDAFAADMFQGGSSSELSVALGATSPDDFATRLVLADTVTAMTNEALSTLQAARADGQAQQAYLVAVRAEVAELKRQADQALAAANTAKVNAQSAKDALDALVAQRAAYTNDVEGRKNSELSQMQSAEAEQARLQAVLVEQARKAREAEAAARAAAASAGKTFVAPNAGTNAKGSNFLDYPANGPITSEFGQRFHPILHIWKLHTGTDFGIGCGTPVYATAPGRVISAGWGGGDGNRIVIDHGIQRGVDLATTYNHLSSFVVRGGSVSRGQLIAYSGNTGYSTGCHLHFETLEDGQFVNPRTWI
ncbi:MAG: peptidoglycan DD-metalloendopeptidase family protein [Dermatophilaceae bacterium]